MLVTMNTSYSITTKTIPNIHENDNVRLSSHDVWDVTRPRHLKQYNKLAP